MLQLLERLENQHAPNDGRESQRRVRGPLFELRRDGIHLPKHRGSETDDDSFTFDDRRDGRSAVSAEMRVVDEDRIADGGTVQRIARDRALAKDRKAGVVGLDLRREAGDVDFLTDMNLLRVE